MVNNFELSYIIKSKKWLNYIRKEDIYNYIENIFNNVIEILNYKISNNKIIELSIIFTDDKNIQKLNKNFRNIDKPTNVLSFPLYEKEFKNVLKYENYIAIGDIVLSIETIEKESLGQSFTNHLTHLIVHSLLHLFGYDHIDEKEGKEMENLEIDILYKMSIDNPYK